MPQGPKGEKRPADVIGVIFLSMLAPVALSLLGPIYYGYSNGPHWRVAIWALASTIGFLWLFRSSLVGGVVALLIIAAVAAVFFGVGDYAAYFLVRSISN